MSGLGELPRCSVGDTVNAMESLSARCPKSNSKAQRGYMRVACQLRRHRRDGVQGGR